MIYLKHLSEPINKHKISPQHQKHQRAAQHNNKSSNNKFKSHSRHNHSKALGFHQCSKCHQGNYAYTNAIDIDDEITCSSWSDFSCRRG